ncbi:MAG: polyphenol oxidase family protein, partial [Phycisphaerae bacterium]|nr:polyphenol oxidase family protein [Phycisphaerae bacterium]
AAIGPCIGVERFQVGPEVAREFEGLFGRDDRIVRDDPRAAGKHLASLRAALERQARAAGVEVVEQVGGCTASEAWYFSHRRDAGVTGRMVAIIGPRG